MSFCYEEISWNLQVEEFENYIPNFISLIQSISRQTVQTNLNILKCFTEFQNLSSKTDRLVWLKFWSFSYLDSQ